MPSNEWRQVSGDVTSSEYGATFAQLDTIGERVYGVNVVQVTNMAEACGSDWNAEREHGTYGTESSYVDVDGMEYRTIRGILGSCGGASSVLDECHMPYSAAKRVVYARQRAADVRKLAAWERRALTEAESTELAQLGTEAYTLRQWFSIPRTARAEMAVSYGGYTDGQFLVFPTLAEAMDYHGIPASALWRVSEYAAQPEATQE